jgi:hypothetical protein
LSILNQKTSLTLGLDDVDSLSDAMMRKVADFRGLGCRIFDASRYPRVAKSLECGRTWAWKPTKKTETTKPFPVHITRKTLKEESASD